MSVAQHDATDFLRRLGEIARIVHEGKDSQDVLERMAYAICFDSPWKSSSIMAVDTAAGKCFEVAHFSRSQADRIRPTAWDLRTSPTTHVVATGEPVIIGDAQAEKDYIEYWTEAQVQHYRTVVLLPLRASDREGRPLVMSIHARDTLAISPSMLTYLSTCADLAGMAVEKGKNLESRTQVIEKLSSVLNLQRGLVAQALRETSVEALIQLCQRYLSSPFIIGDLVLGRAYCGGFKDNASIDALCNGSGWRPLENFFKARGTSKFDKPETLKIGLDAGGGDARVVSQPIIVEGEIIGGIALLVDGQPTAEDIETAEAIWIVLSIALLRNHIRYQANKRSSSEFLSELFEGKLDSMPRELNPHAQIFTQSHMLIALRSASPKTSITAAAWSTSRLVQTMVQRVVFGLVGHFIVLLLPQAEFDEKSLRKLGDQLISEAERLMGGRCLMVEVANCRIPGEYVSAWRRVLRLADWAAANGRFGRISLGEAGAFGVLSEMLDYKLVDEFCHSVLGEVLTHDFTHATALLPTLELLIKYGGRPQPVATDLNVHITTVRNRMQKLKDSFNVDARDAETRFRIEMALRLSKLLPEERSGQPGHVRPLASLVS